MMNVTLSAPKELIEQARLVAHVRHTTLNSAFREWLTLYVARAGSTQDFESLMDRLRHVSSGGRFARDEMNER